MILLCLHLYFAIKINDFKSFQQICVCNGLITGVLRIWFPIEIGSEKLFFNIECRLVIIILILLVRLFIQWSI